MGSKLTLRNNLDNEFTIEHQDGLQNKLIKSNDIAVAVDTIYDLPSVADNGDVVIVRDMNRGGTFVYDATKSAENNGGTVFDGWVRQYSGAVNVKWFGAKGDGITDDTIAIQKAYDTYSIINIVDGVFRVSSISLRSRTRILGNNSGILKAISSSNILSWDGDDTNRLQDFTVSNIIIDGNNVTSSCISLQYVGNAYYEYLDVSNEAYTIQIKECEIYGAINNNIHISNGDAVYITMCNIHRTKKGIWLDDSINSCVISLCKIHMCTTEGVLISNVSSNNTITNCEITNNSGYGVRCYICEQPSILFCTFNRNGLPSGLSTVYVHGIEGYITEAATIKGCLFGANSEGGYDIASTYVTTLNIQNNYFYEIFDNKLAHIRLFTASYGVTISGSRWKSFGIVPLPLKISAVADAEYTLINTGEQGKNEILMVSPNSATRILPVGTIRAPMTLAINSGVLDLSAIKTDTVSCFLSSSVTSVVFPSTPIEGQRLTIRIKQGASNTISGFPADVKFDGGVVATAPALNKILLMEFIFISAEWLEVSRTVL